MTADYRTIDSSTHTGQHRGGGTRSTTFLATTQTTIIEQATDADDREVDTRLQSFHLT